MRKDDKKKPEDACPGDATATTPPRGDVAGRPKSILPPPDPELNGTQKRGRALSDPRSRPAAPCPRGVYRAMDDAGAAFIRVVTLLVGVNTFQGVVN